MKKYCLLFCLLFMSLFHCMSQTTRCVAYECAMGAISEYSGRVTWGDWHKCNIPISINMEESRIRIFSNKEQDYQVVSDWEDLYDDKGESTYAKCIDSDGLVCRVKIRKQYNVGFQIYVEYSDLIWVYNIERY